MLTYLKIKNFAIIEELELEFHSGMTVLTGETGAGKSIVVDGLCFALGARADNSMIFYGKDKCEVTALFDISLIPNAKEWLLENEFVGDHDSCVIHRTFTYDGRTRVTINGYVSTLQLVRELGECLLNVYGQHEHQSLLKKDRQRDLLDSFASHSDLCESLKKVYRDLISEKGRLEKLRNTEEGAESKINFLRYQIKEIDDLNLANGEFDNLHDELKRLSNSESIISNCNTALNLINGDEEAKSVLSYLYASKDIIEKVSNLDPNLKSIVEPIETAILQAETAFDGIEHYISKLEIDPERLKDVESRLNLIHEISRKHRVKPDELQELCLKLREELELLENASLYLEQVEKSVAELESSYFEKARKLSLSRKKAASNLEKMVTEKMQFLSLEGGCFSVNFAANDNPSPYSHGIDQIEFFVRTNAGQQLLPLSKIVSGGELSRISLAIQVITASKTTAPTLIFDEVDVGIGGKTAEIVGRLLKELGSEMQILCITHLPQVAVCGAHHLQVKKNISEKSLDLSIDYIEGEKRIAEVARMLGGINITPKTLANAKEMLSL